MYPIERRDLQSTVENDIAKIKQNLEVLIQHLPPSSRYHVDEMSPSWILLWRNHQNRQTK